MARAESDRTSRIPVSSACKGESATEHRLVRLRPATQLVVEMTSPRAPGGRYGLPVERLTESGYPVRKVSGGHRLDTPAARRALADRLARLTRPARNER